MRVLLAILFWAYSATAFAQETLFKVIDIPVGDDARVERHPTVREGLVEVVVRGCFSDLNIVLTGRTNKYVAGMDAVYVGGGVWIVKAMMRSPGSDLRVVVKNGNLVMDVVKSDKKVSDDDEDLPTVQALVNGTAPSSKANTQFPPLMFLHGDALSYAMSSEDFIPMLPAPAALPRSSWHAIDRARQSMLSAKSEVALAQARYELGWLYLEKGFDREARYYFEYLADSPGALAARDVALARARAALACQHWEEARERLREAYRFGARESVVVEGFGVISLATGVPGRSLTANVLARVTGRPEALLLAAELLQRDGYYKESRPLLEALTGRVSGKTARRVALRLGDARMLAGEMDAAIRSYRKGPGSVRGLSAFRMTLVDLLEKGPSEWAAIVPKMATLAKQSGEVGAEALYLLAQLDRTMGSQVDSISDLSKLLRDHRRIAQRSDVPELMWEMYKERQRVLLDAERWFDVAALHEGAWHPMVRRAVDDPELLIRVADAYEAVGLPHRALHLVREVFPMLLKMEGDDAHLVYRLARLYGETNNSREGLKTLKYLRSRGIPREQLAEVAMLAANLKEIAGDAEGATLELRQAVRSEKYRDEATVWLARMDAEAGRCKQATSVLWSKLMDKRGQKTFKTSRPYLALARCLTASGEGEMAAEAAKLAAARSDSPEESRYASYIAASALSFPGDSNQERLQKGSDIWAALSADHVNAEELESEINQRKVPTEY